MNNTISHKDRKIIQMKKEILDSTIELIEEEGPRDITLLKISKRLGLTKQALYHYYKSKEILLFETIIRELIETADIIELETEKANNGNEAIETLMRTFFNRYINRINIFSLVYNTYPHLDLTEFASEEKLKDVHALNKKIFGNCERLLKIDQKDGTFSKNKNPRVFSFNAQTAVIGILNIVAMTRSINDPLIHSEKKLISDICQTFKYAFSGE